MAGRTFTPGETGYLVEQKKGRGSQHSEVDYRAQLMRFVELSGEGRNLKLVFESVRGGWRTCVNAVEFATGQMTFTKERPPAKGATL